MKRFKSSIFLLLLLFNLFLITPVFAQDSGGSPPSSNGNGSGTSNIWETPGEDNCYLLHPPDQSQNGGGVFIDAANAVSSILPSTPNFLRLPTLISTFAGQGSLAGNLAVELYSTIWQYYAVIAFCKFYQLIPGKLT